MWGLRPYLCYCQTVAGLLLLVWGSLSDGRTGLSFTIAAQSFLGPSPVGLVIIFYCLRFETSLFVVSYDSQGYGAALPILKVKVTLRLTVSQSVSLS
jgi:hypothetical protein